MQESEVISVNEDKGTILIKRATHVQDGSPRPLKLSITHDYLEIGGPCDFIGDNGAPIKARAALQIDIRTFHDVVIPLLQRSPELDSNRFKSNNKKEVPYLDKACIVEHTQNGRQVVTFRRAGDLHYETVSKEIFDMVRMDLKLNTPNEDKKEEV